MIKQSAILLLLLVIVMHCIGQDVATPKWMHIKVDGDNNEWGSLNFYDDQTQLNFGLANDSNNIYLCFQTVNEPTQMKIMRAGMKISLTSKGKPKHEASILFPMPQHEPQQVPDSSHNDMSKGGGVFNKNSFRQNFIAHHTTMQVNGFAHANGNVPVNDSDIQVAVNWDSASNLIYEVAIAKKEFFGDADASKDAANDITLEVEVNALPHYAGEKTGGYHGGGMSGGMQGGGGMHGYGGNHGGGFNHDHTYGGQQNNSLNAGNNTSLSTKTSFKQKFVLNNGSN